MVALALALTVSLSSAPKVAKTQLKIDVKPQDAVVFLDGKRVGTGEKVHTVTVEPGIHSLRVVYKRDEHSEEIKVKKDEVLNWQWAFEDAANELKIPVEDKSESKPKVEPVPPDDVPK